MRRSHPPQFPFATSKRAWARYIRQKVSSVRSSAAARSRTIRMIERNTSHWYCRKSVSNASRSPAANRSRSSTLRLHLLLLAQGPQGYMSSRQSSAEVRRLWEEPIEARKKQRRSQESSPLAAGRMSTHCCLCHHSRSEAHFPLASR